MRTGYRWLAGLAGAALACSSGGNGPSDPGNDGPDGDVIVANNSFTPATFGAALNQTVVWEWNSGTTQHNVTFDDGLFSANLATGTYERIFTVAGSYPYHCTIHGAAVMAGVVNVAASPGTGGGGGYGRSLSPARRMP